MITIPNLGILGNNAYIIKNGKNAILIDAPPKGEKILDILNKNQMNTPRSKLAGYQLM